MDSDTENKQGELRKIIQTKLFSIHINNIVLFCFFWPKRMGTSQPANRTKLTEIRRQ